MLLSSFCCALSRLRIEITLIVVDNGSEKGKRRYVQSQSESINCARTVLVSNLKQTMMQRVAVRTVHSILFELFFCDG